jgi:outer membrane protein insertion porin family
MVAAPLLLLGAISLAASDRYEGQRVVAVDFVPAEQPLPRKELDRLIALAPGDSYLAPVIRNAIQRLFATGRYADIVVDAETAPGGVAVRFLTKDNYFVGRVSARGSPDPPNSGQIVAASKLQLGTEFMPNDLRQAEESIQTRLHANGLYHAKVTSSTALDRDIEQINIDFSIDPGPRAKFDGVKLEGDPARSPKAVIRSTKWKRPFGLFGWRPLTENRLHSGVENVREYYQKHDRLLAHVTLSALNYNDATNTVTPTLTIRPGPVVKVTTTGAKMSRGRLKQLLPIYQERSVDRSLLVEGTRNLVDYFQSQGYFDVSVNFTYLPENQGEQIVEYNIDKQQRHKLANVEITGNRYFDTDTIRERMYITPATFLRFRHGRYSERYLEKDIDSIEDLYRSNGFRDVQVKSAVKDDYRGNAGELGVQLQIEEGPQWLVNSLKLSGIDEGDRDYLTSLLHSTAGQPFSEFNIATDRDAVLSYYYNNGYPNATFDWVQTPGADPHRVDLEYIVKPGQRQFVRKVIVNGLSTTNPDLVNQRIDIKPGDPLSQVRISDAQRRLYDLGIFAKVQTAVQNPEGLEDSKYVLYQFEEARRYSMNVGFGAEVARIGGGVTTFDAPAGAAGFAPRVSLGVSRLNFLGLGHTVSAQTRVSTLQKRGLISYFAPQFQGSDRLNLTFTALFDDSRDVRTFAARRLEGSIQLGQKVTRASTVQYRISYRDVFVDPNSVKINQQLIPLLSQSVRVGQVSTTFVQDRRDDPVDAHKGIYNTVDFGLSLKPFGSQTSFARMVVRNASYHRLTRDWTFARSTNFGFIDRLGGLPEIPLPERFFSGGASTHRGFPDNQAGPRDPITGFPLGGTAVLMNTFELRFPFLGDNVGGVLFHDAGNVYSSLSDVSLRFHQRDLNDFNYMVHAVGFGIRYRTPVGPIRVDLALGLNAPRFFGFRGDRETLLTCSAPGSLTPCVAVVQRINMFQFHFSLGQAF